MVTKTKNYPLKKSIYADSETKPENDKPKLHASRIVELNFRKEYGRDAYLEGFSTDEEETDYKD